MKYLPILITVTLGIASVLLSLSGCDAPSAPVLENPYDFQYTGGPYEYSLELTSDLAYTLSWLDNSENRRRYIMMREDITTENSRVSLEVELDDRSIEDALPDLETIYEYTLELARFERITTTSRAVVANGIIRIFRLFSGNTPTAYSSLTIEGNEIFFWTNKTNTIRTRDMRLTTPPLQLQDAPVKSTDIHRVLLSSDRSVLCSQVAIGTTNSFEDAVEEIRCWSTVTGQLLLELDYIVRNPPRSFTYSFSLNRTGYLALFREQTIEWWRLSDGQLEEVVDNLPDTATEVTLDGATAFINFDDGRSNTALSRPYILATRQLLDKPVEQRAIKVSPDGSILAACSRYSQGIAFYDLNTLLDPGTPSTGFIGSLPDAYDCAFSPDLSQLVTYYNPRFSDSRGIVVFNLSDLDDLDNTLNAEQVVNLSQLFISSRLGITDVEWLPGNTIFTTGDLLNSVQEWSLTPTINVAVTDTFRL